ncbi:uncharacterized protein LOC127777627 [Oryza glaberrima]|uniref:uncharacterized protein LOC127777627 n=1 Tax=Oryza glaberrima TaxID=4538 RepID=UPI00224BEED5|nr:uncharacterized protein LOC127777627 [Oryza glaberrima]
MLHEAAVNHSIYSPDTNSPHVSSPVFVTSFAGPTAAPTLSSPAAAKDSQIDEFINDIATPIQPPLLPTPDVNVRKPSRVKRYKKPLSPASLKTIADLVEKGGYKAIRLKVPKKKASVAPL